MVDETLTQIKGVGEKTAEKLQVGGFKTVEEVATAKAEDLLKIGLAQGEVKGIIASARGLSGGEREKKESFWRFG